MAIKNLIILILCSCQTWGPEKFILTSRNHREKPHWLQQPKGEVFTSPQGLSFVSASYRVHDLQLGLIQGQENAYTSFEWALFLKESASSKKWQKPHKKAKYSSNLESKISDFKNRYALAKKGGTLRVRDIYFEGYQSTTVEEPFFNIYYLLEYRSAK